MSHGPEQSESGTKREDNNDMRNRYLLVVLLFLRLGSIRADEHPAAKPWEALWRFDTHG